MHVWLCTRDGRLKAGPLRGWYCYPKYLFLSLDLWCKDLVPPHQKKNETVSDPGLSYALIRCLTLYKRCFVLFFILTQNSRKSGIFNLYLRLGFQWTVIASMRCPRQVVCYDEAARNQLRQKHTIWKHHFRYLISQNWASHSPRSVNQNLFFFVEVEFKNNRISLKCCPSVTSYSPYQWRWSQFEKCY